MVDADELHGMVDMVGERGDGGARPLRVEAGDAVEIFLLRFLVGREDGIEARESERAREVGAGLLLFVRDLVEIFVEGDDLDGAALRGQRLHLLV
jgi:hypothetical protein